MQSSQLCYNKGCGIKYDDLSAKDDDCCHHPGIPVFHDAYKSWSCCTERSTDFTTFLNIKGCHRGKHNPVKPLEPEKGNHKISNKEEVIVVRPPMEENTERSDFETEMSTLNAIVSQSLKTALENEVNGSKIKALEQTDEDEGTIIGECCKNNTCKASYSGEESNLDACLHHPGVPIFHEGWKYWTCCKKKTTEFDVFLNQKGCTTGSHIWIKKETTNMECRYDWHQTTTHVYIAIYAKLSQQKLSFFKVNPIRLQSKIIFGEDREFYFDRELCGVIDISQCTVTMAASKVEIKMKKADCQKWNDLFVVSKIDEESGGCNTDLVDLNSDLDGVDLSDI